MADIPPYQQPFGAGPYTPQAPNTTLPPWMNTDLASLMPGYQDPSSGGLGSAYLGYAQNGVPNPTDTGFGQQLQQYMGGYDPAALMSPYAPQNVDQTQLGQQLMGYLGQQLPQQDVMGMLGGMPQAPSINWRPSHTEYAPTDTATFDPAEVARIDPSGAFRAAQGYLQTVTNPSVLATAQASGMGRSGAEVEALTNAGVQLQLPIERQILDAESQANLQQSAQVQQQRAMEANSRNAASLQAQGLTAQDQNSTQAIYGQMESDQAKIAGNLMAAGYSARAAAAAAQAEVNARLSLGQYQTNAQAGLSMLGMNNNNAQQTQQLMAGLYGNQYNTNVGAGLNMLGQNSNAAQTGYTGTLNAYGNLYSGDVTSRNNYLNNLTATRNNQYNQNVGAYGQQAGYANQYNLGLLGGLNQQTHDINTGNFGLANTGLLGTNAINLANVNNAGQLANTGLVGQNSLNLANVNNAAGLNLANVNNASNQLISKGNNQTALQTNQNTNAANTANQNSVNATNKDLAASKYQNATDLATQDFNNKQTLLNGLINQMSNGVKPTPQQLTGAGLTVPPGYSGYDGSVGTGGPDSGYLPSSPTAANPFGGPGEDGLITGPSNSTPYNPYNYNPYAADPTFNAGEPF